MGQVTYSSAHLSLRHLTVAIYVGAESKFLGRVRSGVGKSKVLVEASLSPEADLGPSYREIVNIPHSETF
ncbi:hypothetical protein HPP92_028311 [Vanilla planifolia]|uniref:Uncharacterized protein n=1 Tax=Vanilla planifolia TaxID=51239 RepID=A0A835P942_VANPL|nr:hypothetical protein HPP92_028311 [Vanilla planifolia]KAG0447562.1 hypothetical protein HPP92_028280 [Vanilla planifolia]